MGHRVVGATHRLLVLGTSYGHPASAATYLAHVLRPLVRAELGLLVAERCGKLFPQRMDTLQGRPRRQTRCVRSLVRDRDEPCRRGRPGCAANPPPPSPTSPVSALSCEQPSRNASMAAAANTPLPVLAKASTSVVGYSACSSSAPPRWMSAAVPVPATGRWLWFCVCRKSRACCPRWWHSGAATATTTFWRGVPKLVAGAAAALYVSALANSLYHGGDEHPPFGIAEKGYHSVDCVEDGVERAVLVDVQAHAYGVDGNSMPISP